MITNSPTVVRTAIALENGDKPLPLAGKAVEWAHEMEFGDWHGSIARHSCGNLASNPETSFD